jgi:hypothetical protein
MHQVLKVNQAKISKAVKGVQREGAPLKQRRVVQVAEARAEEELRRTPNPRTSEKRAVLLLTTRRSELSEDINPFFIRCVLLEQEK